MVMERILSMLATCGTDSPLFPPTDLCNEGWLLRLVLDWFSTHDVPGQPLTFLESARWFSEALLPSAFLARRRGDPLAEGWTHADGAIGHFDIGDVGKGDLSLRPDGQQLVVVEAKMFSLLSRRVTHAEYYDQAARTVACMAEVLNRADRHPSHLTHLGFYVVAPQSKIAEGVFAKEMTKESIGEKVKRRVSDYDDQDKDRWHTDWFQPTLDTIDIGVLRWEDMVGTIGEHDAESGDAINEFYDLCVEHNQ